MTIQIPEDLARGLEGLAAVRKTTVEQLALERLRTLFDRPTSPRAVLQALQALTHPNPSTVDDLEAGIAEARLPIDDRGVFDR